MESLERDEFRLKRLLYLAPLAGRGGLKLIVV
jgi:hypothetical protein